MIAAVVLQVCHYYFKWFRAAASLPRGLQKLIRRHRY
jgi:hypothetical protein